MEIKAVIFDFDGPINDSFREGLRRIEVIAGMHGIPFTKTERQRIISLWGGPGAELLEKGLVIPKARAEELYAKWELWDLLQSVPLVPGARETLRWNHGQKIVNTLLTSRNKKNLTDIFEKIGLANEFEIISTRQDTLFPKPDPRAFEFVLRELSDRFDISKKHCIFVGDNKTDILCGTAVRIETLVVMTGQYWLEDIAKYPIELKNILPSIDYLPEWIEKHQD